MHKSRNVSPNSTTIYQSRCFLLNASRHFHIGTVWSKDGANRVHVARKVVVSPVSKPNTRACENPFSSPPALKSLRDQRLRPPLPRPRWSPPEQAPLGRRPDYQPLFSRQEGPCPIPRTNLASSQKSSSARRTRCPGLPPDLACGPGRLPRSLDLSCSSTNPTETRNVQSHNADLRLGSKDCFMPDAQALPKSAGTKSSSTDTAVNKRATQMTGFATHLFEKTTDIDLRIHRRIPRGNTGPERFVTLTSRRTSSTFHHTVSRYPKTEAHNPVQNFRSTHRKPGTPIAFWNGHLGCLVNTRMSGPLLRVSVFVHEHVERVIARVGE